MIYIKKGRLFLKITFALLLFTNIKYLSIQVDNWWRSVLLYPNSEFGKYEVNIFCPMNLGQNHLQIDFIKTNFPNFSILIG